MTRFAIAADLHLGAGSGLSSDRLADQEWTLNQLADLAATQDVETLLLAGDVFHRPRPTPEVLMVMRRFARRLEALGIPTFAVTGNCGHDIENADRPCALELFASDWIRVSRTPEVIRCVGDIAVCTLPSVPMSRLVARVEGGDRGEVFELATTLLMDVAGDLRGQVPDGWPSILLGHWSVSGASLPNGMPVADLNEVVLPLDQIEQLGFDAAVFGHIHQAQTLTTMSPFVAYTGSPHVVDFGEAHVDHGFWILDVETDGGVEARYELLEDRRFVTVDVDLAQDSPDGRADSQSAERGLARLHADGGSGDQAPGMGARTPEPPLDETDRIAAAIGLPVEGAIVRVRYRATEEQHRRVDRGALRRLLEAAGVDKVHGPTWEPVRTARARVAVTDGAALSDADALDLWCDANDIDDEKRAALHALLEPEAVAA